MLFVSKIYAANVGPDTAPDKLAPAKGMPLIGVLAENSIKARGARSGR
jgi:hypothetical protein